MLGRWENSELRRWEGSKLQRCERWEDSEVVGLERLQSQRGWRAVPWQVGKGAGGRVIEEVARWEWCEGSEVAMGDSWCY